MAYSSNIIPMIWATLGTISESRFGSTHTIFGTLNSWHPFLLCFSDDLGELFWYYSFCGGAHHSWYPFFAQMIVHRTCWNGVPWPAFRERQDTVDFLVILPSIVRNSACKLKKNPDFQECISKMRCNPNNMGTIWRDLDLSFCYSHLSVTFTHSFTFISLTH